MNKPNPHPAKILGEAIRKTGDAQEDLEDAAQALKETNDVLANPLAKSQAVHALARAVLQNLEAESKVKDATQQLETVKELLHDAQVAQAHGKPIRNSGEGTASILGYFEGRRAQQREDDAKAKRKN